MALAVLLLGAPLRAQEAGEEPVPLELRVNRSIAWAVDSLRRRQLPDGSFPGHEHDHPGGATALAAFALAKAGVRRDDPTLVRALAALEGVEMRSVYSHSVNLLLCAALPDGAARRASAERSLAFLVETQDEGLWAYPWGHLCGSNTQFALMALRAAHQLGLEVPERTLADAVEGLFRLQDRSGGFVYEPGGRPYAGMTAAGLAGLAVLAELGGDARLVRAALRKHEKDRRAAEAWLVEHYDPARNLYEDGSWTPFWHAAYLWAVERWCGLTGREEVGGHDWYAETAEWLLATQAADGSWTSDDHPFENTCLVLLFLRRATVSGGELAEIYASIDREHLAAERPPDRPGAQARRLTDWWLAGPWQAQPGEELLLDPPFDPADARPRARGRLARQAWERVLLRDDRWTNLDELVGPDGDRRLWCLATTLTWTPPDGAAPLSALLWLELEDGWDVWLDGERLSRERREQAAINGDVRIPLELAPGSHRLVVLVEDYAGAAAFGALLADGVNGAPPDGLRAGAE